MKNKKSILQLSLLSVLLLTACGNEEAEETPSANSEETVEESGNEGESSGTVEIEDSEGHSVEVPFDPERVAVFDNGQIDNLDQLGLGERLVITATENMPSHLTDYNDLPVAGTLHEVDLEAAFAEDPELAIVAGRSRSSFDSLTDFVPTIDLSNNEGDYWSSLSTNLERLGLIFGVEEEAADLTAELEEEMNDVAARAEESELSTLVAMYNEGSLSAYGPGSRFGVIHDTFGFAPVDENIEASNHGMEISYEYVLEQDPDVLFVIDRTAAIGGDDTSEGLEENPIIQETQAYQNDNIVYLTPDAWYLTEGGAGTFQIMLEEVSAVLD